MRNKNLVILDENNIIQNIVGYVEGMPITEKYYKIFDVEHNQFIVGQNIDCYNKDGSKHANSILISKGLLVLENTQILDGEEIRDKTKLELYKTSIISKDEYNSWAKAERTEAYYNQTDKLNMQLQFDTSISDKERAELETKIEMLKDEIKEKYPYV